MRCAILENRIWRLLSESLFEFQRKDVSQFKVSQMSSSWNCHSHDYGFIRSTGPSRWPFWSRQRQKTSAFSEVVRVLTHNSLPHLRYSFLIPHLLHYF